MQEMQRQDSGEATESLKSLFIDSPSLFIKRPRTDTRQHHRRKAKRDPRRRKQSSVKAKNL